MGVPLWYSSDDISVKFNAGSFRCPSCGEYTQSVVTGYGAFTTLYNLFSLGRRLDWHRVCCSCGKGEKISQKEAREAAILNNAWPDYINAVKNTGLRNLGFVIVGLTLALAVMLLVGELAPVHDGASADMTSLKTSDKLLFGQMYIADIYAYETDDSGGTVSGSFVGYYYNDSDELCALSLRLDADDDIYGQAMDYINDDSMYVGDLSVPVYGVVYEMDGESLRFYGESVDQLSEYVDATVYQTGVNYVGPEYEGLGAEDAIFLGAALLIGLVPLGIYYLAYNPSRPPKSKSKPLGEL